MRLYRFERDSIPDAWGMPVDVQRLAEYVDVELVDKREYNNGYEKLMIDVASDTSGRTFYRPIEVDYWTGRHWYEDDVEIRAPWGTAKRLPEDRYVDALMQPFTREALINDDPS